MDFRRARPDDRPALLAMLQESFAGWQGDHSDAYWTWKFDRNPHGRARIWLGEQSGRVAACYIWNPVLMSAGEETLLGAQSVDAAVHPDFRGRSLFRELARTAVEQADEEGIGLIYAFPTEPAWRGQLRVGFTTQFPVPTIHRPLLLPAARRRRFDELAVSRVEDLDSRFDVFSGSARPHQLKVQRDHVYLQWRYQQHPTQEYEITKCENHGELLGYCVLKIDGRRGEIVDLQVVPGAGGAALTLAQDAVRRLRARGARVGTSFQRPPGPEQDALRACGFSSRYRMLRRLGTQPAYVSQFIAYAAQAASGSGLLETSLRWNLVPSDADYA